VIHPMSLGFTQTFPGVVVRGPRMGNLQGEQGKETENDPNECAQGQGLTLLARRRPGTQSKTIKRLSTSRR
jgi:hypothetical protein